jgi:hypothetical protein
MNRLQASTIQLINQNVTQALRAVDEETLRDVRNEWNAINSSPFCPPVGDVMKRISGICRRGLVQRGERVLKVVLSALEGLRPDEMFLNHVIKVVRKYFPEDQYVALVTSTREGYERNEAPPQKFVNQVFDLAVARFTMDSANLSRQALVKLRIALAEALLQRRATEPTRWKQLKNLGSPAMKWAFVVIAVVAAAFVLYLLKRH